MEEKREFNRIFKQVAISYSLPPNPKALRKITGDISTGGVRFISDRFIPLDSTVKLEISLSDTLKTIKAVARVAWVKTIFSDESYEVGATFIDIDKQDLIFIKEYLINNK